MHYQRPTQVTKRPRIDHEEGQEVNFYKHELKENETKYKLIQSEHSNIENDFKCQLEDLEKKKKKCFNLNKAMFKIISNVS